MAPDGWGIMSARGGGGTIVALSRAPGVGRVRLGELLVKASIITEDQLTAALQEQKTWGGKLGEILVRMNFVSEDVFVRALSKQLGLQRAELGREIPPEILSKIPPEMSEEYEILPVALVEDGRALAVATADPINMTVLDHVRSVVGMRVVPHVAGATALRSVIARLHGSAESDAPMEFISTAEEMSGRIETEDAPPASMSGSRAASGTNPSREAAALKALVELLVQKGVISLDEYIARLKR